jgi:hypothetical protein
VHDAVIRVYNGADNVIETLDSGRSLATKRVSISDSIVYRETRIFMRQDNP